MPILVKDRTTGDVYGRFEGLTSSPCHDWMVMGCTVVKFRDQDNVPWELPLTEVSIG